MTDTHHDNPGLLEKEEIDMKTNIELYEVEKPGPLDTIKNYWANRAAKREREYREGAEQVLRDAYEAVCDEISRHEKYLDSKRDEDYLKVLRKRQKTLKDMLANGEGAE